MPASDDAFRHWLGPSCVSDESDPLAIGQALRLECANDTGDLYVSGLWGREGPQTVAGDNGIGQQAGLGPLGSFIRREAGYPVELEPDGLSYAVNRDGLLARYDAMYLVVLQPVGGVANAQIALDCQGRDASLHLPDELDGQKPSSQQQLSFFHKGAGYLRRLSAATTS